MYTSSHSYVYILLNMCRNSGVGAHAFTNAENLEQMPILAARIVSGLPIFARRKTSLYSKQVGFHYSVGTR